MYFIIETHLMEKVLIHSFSELILFNSIKKSKGLVCNHLSSFLKNYDVIALKVVAFMYIFLGNKITQYIYKLFCLNSRTNGQCRS